MFITWPKVIAYMVLWIAFEFVAMHDPLLATLMVQSGF